jgi:hypothetical protein
MLKVEDKKALLFSWAGKDATSRRIKILLTPHHAFSIRH